MALQIFEQRYLDMVSCCMREGCGFVVPLLCRGSEKHEVNRPGQSVGNTIPFYIIGTYALITDFGQRDNGLLSLTIEGQNRRQLQQIHQQTDGLWVGSTILLEEEGDLQDTPPSQWLELLKQLLELSGMHGIMANLYDLSSEQVMNYLIMLLPLPAPLKQSLLVTNNLNQRWDDLLTALEAIAQR
jgi:Lon protease-like protein